MWAARATRGAFKSVSTSSGGGTMPNGPLFSSGATNREPAQKNTRGATPVRMSIREIAEQKLNQLWRYISVAYRSEEDDLWKSFKEPR